MTARFKMISHEQTVEIEGPEAFVERQIEKIHALLSLIPASTAHSTPTSVGDSSKTENGGNMNADADSPKVVTAQSLDLSVPDNFGEWMYKFSDDMSDQETALMCAFYVQANSSTNDFKTSEINNCLKEHGIKIANPSTNIQRLASKKLTFQTRKVGKLLYMRVSRDGEAHLRSKLRDVEKS
jgi:hypothetical protein